MAPSLNTEGEAETRPQMEEKNKMVFAVDETPTPSRYIRHQYGCEDLFEEVCSGLNPFDEQFRRASQARSQPQINLESSTPHIMALSPRLSNVDTNSSCFHSNPHSQSSRNAGHGSKIRMHRSSPGVCDDDSLDTPRIIPPAPADSDHTISSTSKDDSCHQRYLQDRHYDYDENLSLGHGSERDKDCGCSHNDCSTLHHHREHSNHHCVSSSQFGLSQKSLPFRSISELSARMSNSDITTVTDDEAEEVSGKKRSCHEDEEDDEICVDDNGADVVEFDKRATKRRRTESLEVLSDGPILVSEENVCDVTDGQHKCHDSSGQVKYCNDDLQVVSDASMTESDEGYSSVRYPPSSHQEFAPSLMGSCETNFSPQNARTNRRCSGGRAGFSGRQKLSINVTSAAEAGMSSSSVISTPTPVITAGPSLTQCLRDAYPCSDERIVEDSFVSNSSHPCRTQPTTDHRLSNLSSHPSSSASQHSSLSPHESSLTQQQLSGLPPDSLPHAHHQDLPHPLQRSEVAASAGAGNSSTVITGPALPPASPSATVLQLFLRLPNGQAIPVEIPATPLVSTQSSSMPAAYTPPQQEQLQQHPPNKPSLAKMRLKAALTASQTAARPSSRPPPSRALTAHRIASLTRPTSRQSNLNNPSIQPSNNHPQASNNHPQPSNNHPQLSNNHSQSSNNHHQSSNCPQIFKSSGLLQSSISNDHVTHQSSSNHVNLSNASSSPQQVSYQCTAEFTQPVSQEPLASYPCSVLTTSSVSDSLHSNGSLDKNSNGQRGKKRIVAPGEDDDEEKRMKFLERNRAAAVRCREKKKEWVKKLASKSTELATVNTRLQAEVASLRADVATLKGLLLQHKTCPVTLAALAGAYTDAAPAAPEGAPMPHNGVLTADSEDQQKPRSRSLSLPSLHQKPQQLQPPSALVANNVPQVLSVVAAGLPASTEGKADLTSATSHIPETSQAVPADLRTTNCLTRQSVLTLPIPMTSSIPINGSVVSAPSLSSTTKFIPVPAVHTSLVPGVINQQPPTFLSIHQPGPMTQAHAVVTFPNFSQAPLYCSSLPTFMTVPTTITNAVPIVSPYHHIQSSAEPAQPQPLAIAPAPLKMTPRLSSSRPAAANKEHFTLTSLAASLQFVQSSLTSSSRILSLPGSTSELNERATVTGVPGFTSSNLSVGNGPALVLDSSQPRLLLPSLSGQGSYIHGPVLSAQHIQHTTLTQHLALPLNCSDEAPTTAAILEDIAEIEESSSKIQSVGPASQEAPNEGTETVPYSIQSGDDAREKFHGSNVLVSTAHAAGTSETNVPLAGRPHNFLSIPTIVVSDESCGKVDDHNMDVSRCMPESGPTGTGPYHAIASSVQPSNVLGSTTSNTTTLYVGSLVKDAYPNCQQNHQQLTVEGNTQVVQSDISNGQSEIVYVSRASGSETFTRS
ncbi:mucin-17 isoform X2 [Hyalella azteca]|nr:mucin-17 isoform X2 [Hyalella azteca]